MSKAGKMFSEKIMRVLSLIFAVLTAAAVAAEKLIGIFGSFTIVAFLLLTLKKVCDICLEVKTAKKVSIITVILTAAVVLCDVFLLIVLLYTNINRA